MSQVINSFKAQSQRARNARKSPRFQDIGTQRTFNAVVPTRINCDADKAAANRARQAAESQKQIARSLKMAKAKLQRFRETFHKSKNPSKKAKAARNLEAALREVRLLQAGIAP